MSPRSRPATEPGRDALVQAPARAKRLMRAVWRRLPRSALTYKLAKAVTRTLLRPEPCTTLVDVRVGGRCTMRVDLGDIVGNDVYCMDDHYEAPTLALWRALAADAGTVVDLGSHVGLYACAAAAVAPRARILAVEAYEPNVRLLVHNLAPFCNATAVHATIGTGDGRALFRVSPITGGGYVETSGSTPGVRGRTATVWPVETTSLAALCTRHAISRIDLLKIDLEGLEDPLLAGEDAFWTRTAPRHVLVEIATPAGAKRGRSFTVMAARGYRARRLERLHTFPLFRHEDLSNWHFWRER